MHPRLKYNDKLINMILILQIFQLWCPTHMRIKEEDHTFSLPKRTKPINHVKCEGFVYEAQHVRERLLNGESHFNEQLSRILSFSLGG